MTTAPHHPPVLDYSASARTELVWGVVAGLAAFGTYFCMYMFRKPFGAATFPIHVSIMGRDITLKVLIVTSQTAGYALSKFIGVKVISEIEPRRRAPGILLLIGIAEAALLAFAVIPPPWNVLCFFLNGLPLGMVFGLVLGVLEGRRMTEALAAALCLSFILAGGVAKSVGAFLLQHHVSQYWMPAAAGAIFLAPLAFCVWMLTLVPPPDAEDVASRSRRTPMNHAERRSFFARYALGLSLIVAMYLLVTILRSIRDDFAPEIWRSLGAPAQPSTFTKCELLISIGVLVVNGCAVFIRDNRVAFFAAMLTSLGGLLLMGVVLLAGHFISAFWFMTLTGLGLYLPYVAVQATMFERLMAMTQERGNIGFLVYVADSIGYLGYVAVIIGNDVIHSSAGFGGFFRAICWIVFVVSTACVALSCVFFAPRQPAISVAGFTPVVAAELSGTM